MAQQNRKEANTECCKGTLNFLITTIITVASVLLILAAFAAAYLHFSPKHNSEMLVKSYIHYIAEKDWEAVYAIMPLEDSFILETDFINFCNNNPNAMDFASSPISDFVIEKDMEDNDFIYYSVNYVAQDNTNGTFYITVEKDEHKIIPTSKNICSLTIYAPDKSTVSLNGKALDKPEQLSAGDSENGSNYYFCSYTVDYILTGTYELKAENEFFEPVETTFEINPGEKKEIYVESSMNENTFNALCGITAEYINNIYSNIISGNSDYSSIIVSEYYAANGFNDDINILAKDINYTNNINVTDFKLTASESAKPFNEYKTIINCGEKSKIQIRLNYDYSYTYTSDNYVGKAFTESRNDSGYFYADYVYENGSWKLCEISGKAWF